MDKKTNKILYELSKNSRLPLKQLAKKVGLSESTASYRLSQLYEKKIILSTAPIVDHSKIGHTVYRAYSKFFGTNPQKEQEIFKWLEKQREVSILATSHGECEILIMSIVSSPQKFHDFVKRFKAKYRKNIDMLETFTYLKTYHFSREYLNQGEKVPRKIIITGESNLEKIDNLDKKILKSLAYDARKPVLKIAEEIKSPVRTVANRLKSLEKRKIIAGYSLNLDLSKMGREYFKLNIIGNQNIDYSSLIDFATQLDSSIYVDETIGKYDFELNIEVKNKEELNEVIKLIKEKMKGVRKLSIFQINKYLKLTYLGD